MFEATSGTASFPHAESRRACEAIRFCVETTCEAPSKDDLTGISDHVRDRKRACAIDMALDIDVELWNWNPVGRLHERRLWPVRPSHVRR